MDDTLITVYEMPGTPDISALDTTVGFGENWYGREESNGDAWHWAQSPAQLILTSPKTQTVSLELMFFTIYIPPDAGNDYQSRLQVSLNNGPITVVEIEAGKLTTIPLELPPGKHTLVLNLEAGSFQPTALGGDDPRHLSFAVRYINLRTSLP